MPGDDFLDDRRKALEEQFFAKESRKLLNKLKHGGDDDGSAGADDERVRLADASGISDRAVLDKLLAAHITSETLAAISLVPLVQVAWADGKVQAAEREAILKAADQQGLAQGSAAHQLLEAWLGSPPDDQVFETWREYIQALIQTLDGDTQRSLRTTVLDRARAVAEAAGGFLGLGSKVSKEEEAVLASLQRAFE